MNNRRPATKRLASTAFPPPECVTVSQAELTKIAETDYDFEVTREAIEDAEAEELQDRRDEYDDDDDDRFGFGRRYEPDDPYQ